MRFLVVAIAPTVAGMYLFVAARLMGWAESLMETSATIRRIAETTY